MVTYDPVSMGERERFKERMPEDPSQPDSSNRICKNIGTCKMWTQGGSGGPGSHVEVAAFCRYGE